MPLMWGVKGSCRDSQSLCKTFAPQIRGASSVSKYLPLSSFRALICGIRIMHHFSLGHLWGRSLAAGPAKLFGSPLFLPFSSLGHLFLQSPLIYPQRQTPAHFEWYVQKQVPPAKYGADLCELSSKALLALILVAYSHIDDGSRTLYGYIYYKRRNWAAQTGD